MDQGGQRRDQVDATVVPNVRRQRGAAPASCTRLQPRQFLADAGDARADQGLVTDESEGKADQDRREGGESSRPLCYLPDGRGRHRTANVPGDFAPDRGATAAATTSASVRRSMSCIQEQPTEGVRPNARKMARSDPRPSVRVTRGVGSGQHLASVLQEGRENANIGLGFIWRISDKTMVRSTQMARKYMQSLCLAALLAFPASLALANHIDSATVALACTQYGIKVTASDLAPGDSYSIRYTFILSSTTGGPPLTISNTVPVTKPLSSVGNYNFTDSVTNSLSLVGNYNVQSPSGSASLLSNNQTVNTIPITFSPTTLNCSPPA